MVLEVFPSHNDIGGAGAGRVITEANLLDSFDRLSRQTTILSGMEPSDGGGLTVTIAPGRCSIAGYIVRFTAAEDVTVSDDTAGYLWLQVSGATPPATATAWVETADLSSPPANSALVTKFITSGGAISSVTDRERREGEGSITGSFAGDGGDDEHQDIDLGLTPRLVIAKARIFEITAGLPRIGFSISNIFPGNVEWDNFDETKKGLPWWQMYFSSGIVPPRDGNQAAGWTSQADDSGGLGIIPNGFTAYNGDDLGYGMNRSGTDYDYIAWF